MWIVPYMLWTGCEICQLAEPLHWNCINNCTSTTAVNRSPPLPPNNFSWLFNLNVGRNFIWSRMPTAYKSQAMRQRRQSTPFGDLKKNYLLCVPFENFLRLTIPVQSWCVKLLFSLLLVSSGLGRVWVEQYILFQTIIPAADNYTLPFPIYVLHFTSLSLVFSYCLAFQHVWPWPAPLISALMANITVCLEPAAGWALVMAAAPWTTLSAVPTSLTAVPLAIAVQGPTAQGYAYKVFINLPTNTGWITTRQTRSSRLGKIYPIKNFVANSLIHCILFLSLRPATESKSQNPNPFSLTLFCLFFEHLILIMIC